MHCVKDAIVSSLASLSPTVVSLIAEFAFEVRMLKYFQLDGHGIAIEEPRYVAMRDHTVFLSDKHCVLRFFGDMSTRVWCVKPSNGLAVDSDGKVLAVLPHKKVLQEFNWHPEPLRQLYESKEPAAVMRGVAYASASRRLCILEEHNRATRVVVLERDGKFVRAFPIESSSAVDAAVFDYMYLAVSPADQNIFVSNPVDKCVQIYTQEGKLDGVLRLPLREGSSAPDCPSGVAVDALGNAYVCTAEGNDVHVFGRDRKHTLAFGSFGFAFNRPSGICVDEYGRVLVCDTMNHRVCRFVL